MRRLNGVEEIDDFSKKADSCWDEYVPTGFPQLDAAIGGGLSTGLTILCGADEPYKSTLLEQIATNISGSGREVLFITNRTRKMIAAKAISRQSYLQAGENGAFTAAELQTENIIKHLNYAQNRLYQNSCRNASTKWARFSFLYNKDKSWTVSGLEKYVQREWLDCGHQSPVIFIDHRPMVFTEDMNDSDDMENTWQFPLALKSMSARLQALVFTISSQDIPNADMILNIQPASGEQVHSDSEEKQRKNMEIKVLKNKEGKSGAKILMGYHEQFAYFVESDWKEDRKNKNGR